MWSRNSTLKQDVSQRAQAKQFKLYVNGSMVNDIFSGFRQTEGYMHAIFSNTSYLQESDSYRLLLIWCIIIPLYNLLPWSRPGKEWSSGSGS